MMVKFKLKDAVSRFASLSSAWAGSPTAILMVTFSIVLYVAVGYLVRFSDEYQLVANTFMSAVSYMLLFLIQSTQNRESRALHLKLDELILAIRRADNRLIGIEELTEEQLLELSIRYRAIFDRNQACETESSTLSTSS